MTPLQKTQAADDTPAEEQSTGILRPNNVDEFYDAVEAHLRQNGRTTMRRLGNFVALPPGGQSLKLKKLLLERRDRFIIDLSGSVEINHSRTLALELARIGDEAPPHRGTVARSRHLRSAAGNTDAWLGASGFLL